MLPATSLVGLSCLIALAQATPFELHARAGCGNNCARAVIASSFPGRPTKADCSSYLASTVTPPTFTITATVTNQKTDTTIKTEVATDTERTTRTDVATAYVTTTVTLPANGVDPLSKRQNKVIPTYAFACKDPAAYIEACGCIGVSAYTVTAPTPSQTVPATVTQTKQETSVTTITKTLTETDVELVTTTLTSVTTATPLPTQVVRNGDFEAPLAGTWLSSKSGPIDGSLQSVTGPFGEGLQQSLYLIYSETQQEDNGVRGSYYLTQRVSVQPETEYELSYSWQYNNGRYGYCASYVFFTPQTNADFPGGFPGYPTTPIQQSTVAGQNTWIRSTGRITTQPGVSAGTVVLVVACEYSYYMDMVVFVEGIAMTKV